MEGNIVLLKYLWEKTQNSSGESDFSLPALRGLITQICIFAALVVAVGAFVAFKVFVSWKNRLA